MKEIYEMMKVITDLDYVNLLLINELENDDLIIYNDKQRIT